MHHSPIPINTTHSHLLQFAHSFFLPSSFLTTTTTARVSSIVALLAVALLVADAYAYRTTVTTVEVDDDDNQGWQERCRIKGQLRSCKSFLRQSRGYLQMKGVEENQLEREQGLEECCRELRNVEEQCRCDALEDTARKAQKERGQQGSQILQKARMLPSMCQISPQRCDF